MRDGERRFRALATASAAVLYQVSADWMELQPLDGKGLVPSNDAPIRGWFELNVAAVDRAVVWAEIQRCIATKSTFDMEHRTNRPDGQTGWTRSRAVPLLGEDGEIEEWVGTAEDITPRKEAEEQLRRSHDTFYHLIQNNPFGVYAVDADFRLRQVSAGAAKVFAQVPRPLLGRDFGEVLRSVWAEPFAGEAIARFRHTLETGEPYVAPRTVEQRQDVDAIEAYDWRIERLMLPDGRPGVVCYFYDLSERQRWEAALRESEARFRLMADAVPQIVWITDALGRVEFFNQQWSRYTGLGYLPATADEVAATAIHPDDATATIAAFAAARRTGGTFAVEHRIRAASGEYRWFLVRGEPYRDPETGEIVRWFGASIDIHERRTAEDARRRIEFRWQRLIEQSPLSIQVFAPDGTVRQVNRAWERLWGITLDDVPGYNVRLDPQLRAHGMSERFERAFAGEAVTIDAVPYVLDHGEHAGAPRWVGAYVYPVKDEAGRVEEVVLVHEDVTDRRRAEDALRESEARLREVADAMPQMVWVTRADGHHEYYNRRWYEFTGVAEHSTDGEAWARVLHPDDQPRAWAAWRHSLATGEPYEIEYRLRHRGGEHRWALGRALPIRGPHGGIERWIGTCTDIDAMRRLTAERERLLDSERHARADAERAVRMKDEFLATLSHELRTPLSAILGWSQILRRGTANPETLREGLGTIERNARAQSQIIDDLLDMSRIISGKVGLDARPIDLGAVVGAAVETVRTTAAAKGVSIDFDGGVERPDAAARRPILGDFNRLQQVFWNLLTNAVKFTPRGGRVEVRVGQLPGQWQVDVVDSGEGIAAEFLPHVFERFRQADASTTRRHGGLGLGLAIAKQLVELHGGRVRAHSEGPGRGATFGVSLPLADAGDGADEPPAGTDAAAPPVITPDGTPSAAGRPAVAWDAALTDGLRGARVVVVDDEPDARQLVQRLLSDCGCEVFVAADAEEALALVAAHRPGLLVSDIGMPGTDGYALLRKLRALHPEAGGATPAIALTAYARAEDRVKAVRAGFQLHVPKPVEPAELVTMVASLLARRGE